MRSGAVAYHASPQGHKQCSDEACQEGGAGQSEPVLRRQEMGQEEGDLQVPYTEEQESHEMIGPAYTAQYYIHTIDILYT